MIYGYARISTTKQKLERQEANIKREYPDAIIIKEAYTGTTTDRPNWNKLMKRVKAEDTIVFDEVSRMSRNAEEGFKVYQELFDRGVSLVFLKERHINTDVYKESMKDNIPTTGTDVDIILNAVKTYLMVLAKKQIEIAFQSAQAEVDHLHQRTKEGMEQARLNGKQIGRIPGTKIETQKAKKTKEVILKLSKTFNGTMNDTEIIELTGVDRHTYYKYKKQLMTTTD